MKEYVAGFLFSKDNKRVVLIRKKRPTWQAGRLNAVGGHIEKGETPLAAMRREFCEEAGLDVPDWEQFASMEAPDWTCQFYRAWGDVTMCETRTDEEICVFDVRQVKLMGRPVCIGNIPWLLPLALDLEGGLKLPVNIVYT